MASSPLGDDHINHTTANIGESKIANGVTVGSLFVVETQEMQKSGMKVVDMDMSFHGAAACVVRGPVGHISSLHHRLGTCCSPGSDVVGHCQHFVPLQCVRIHPPNKKGVFQKTSLFETGVLARDGLVHIHTIAGKSITESLVMVPASSSYLDEPHPDSASRRAMRHCTENGRDSVLRTPYCLRVDFDSGEMSSTSSSLCSI